MGLWDPIYALQNYNSTPNPPKIKSKHTLTQLDSDLVHLFPWDTQTSPELAKFGHLMTLPLRMMSTNPSFGKVCYLTQMWVT